MRIVANEQMSLDGVMQGPGGPEEDTDGGFKNGGWFMNGSDDVVGTFVTESIANADAMFFGRRTWQISSAFWPEQSGSPFADALNAKKKYVASNTLTDSDMLWNTTLLPGNNAVEAIAELRKQDGGDLLTYGSLKLVRELLVAELIDELNLMIAPIMVGGGKTLFPNDGVARTMRLVDSKAGPSGKLLCTYRPA